MFHYTWDVGVLIDQIFLSFYFLPILCPYCKIWLNGHNYFCYLSLREYLIHLYLMLLLICLDLDISYLHIFIFVSWFIFLLFLHYFDIINLKFLTTTEHVVQISSLSIRFWWLKIFSKENLRFLQISYFVFSFWQSPFLIS